MKPESDRLAVSGAKPIKKAARDRPRCFCLSFGWHKLARHDRANRRASFEITRQCRREGGLAALARSGGRVRASTREGAPVPVGGRMLQDAARRCRWTRHS